MQGWNRGRGRICCSAVFPLPHFSSWASPSNSHLLYVHASIARTLVATFKRAEGLGHISIQYMHFSSSVNVLAQILTCVSREQMGTDFSRRAGAGRSVTLTWEIPSEGSWGPLGLSWAGAMCSSSTLLSWPSIFELASAFPLVPGTCFGVQRPVSNCCRCLIQGDQAAYWYP